MPQKCVIYSIEKETWCNMIKKTTPILYQRKADCYGCTACYAICPKDAISMVEDEEGFEYPKIDESECIGCYQCIKVCPLKKYIC